MRGLVRLLGSSQPEQLLGVVRSDRRITATGFMIIHPGIIGIDVSEGYFVLGAESGRTERLPNCAEAACSAERLRAGRARRLKPPIVGSSVACAAFTVTGRRVPRRYQMAAITVARWRPASPSPRGRAFRAI